MTSLELPTCSTSALLRCRLSRLGLRVARPGLSQELAVSLCRGAEYSGLLVRSRDRRRVRPDTGASTSWCIRQFPVRSRWT